MTELSPQTAFLRQYALEGAPNSGVVYSLPLAQEVLLGRDPECQVIVDSHTFSGVSRYHAKIFPTANRLGWQLCDLDSTNGTFLNGRRLRGTQVLCQGDRIALGQKGPHYGFELQSARTTSGQHSPTDPLTQALLDDDELDSVLLPTRDRVTASQLFPILSTGQDLAHKAYLVPGMVTVSFVVLMFVSVGNPPLFNTALAIYLALAANYFVYQLCGKPKPWWLLVGSAAMTVLVLLSPILSVFLLVFQKILPGDVPSPFSGNLLTLAVQMFFGAGLMEELLKALPILLALAIGSQLRSPWRERIGVWEPLDGILLGTSSAVGFTLLETLGQYVPEVVQHMNTQVSQDLSQLSGLQILIARVLGSIAGHLAYSGYLGYFIGLSVLKPRRRWQILGVGYLTAALLHTLWNIFGIVNLFALAAIGSLSYAFLAAAILKARALSPNREHNFATRFSQKT